MAGGGDSVMWLRVEDEESDSTNEEMPPLEPLEPLEGAAQLGEVWLCGHERRM